MASILLNAATPTSLLRQPPFAATVLLVCVVHVWGLTQFAHRVRQPVMVARAVRAIQATDTRLGGPNVVSAQKPPAQPPRQPEVAKVQSKPISTASLVPGPGTHTPSDSTAAAMAPFASASEATASSDAEALTAVSAFLLPNSGRLQYSSTGSARGRAVQASSTLVWRQDGQGFEAQWEIAPAQGPTRLIRSVGHITPDGLAPERYSDRSRSESATHFMRDQGKIVFSANTPAVDLKVAAQDRLSLVFQLSALLAAQPARFGPNTRIAIQTAGARAAQTWVFTVGPMENLELSGGSVAALKLTRSSRGAYDPTVELWFAPTQHYWPVRLRQSQPNGDFQDHVWTGASPL